ncbi:hypothetical protein RWH45_14355 [Microbacterium sp. KSW4-17]|uniref:Uncharacterized protein n=1 Tax=Microbacterium galbum TaxID=3075994 RepID=A0ABU3TAL0_9MICO|nr:hypothetical protein [Microbacterium sp. KSW4-17]MDU0368398.1 hypothetical protein [Microbacterium sp. KSW4-17]
MSARLLFPDPQAAADLLTFSSRTIRLGDGTVRLRARGGMLVTTAAPLAPRGLMDATPTVLGLRASAIDPELECDLVVEASALLPAPDDANAVVLPETATSPAWAGISPPQGGWEQTDAVDSAVLAARAQYGVAAVADALPADAGEDVVRVIRAQVWGQADEALGGLPLGVAFAAFALGFIAGGEEAPVRRSGAWTRLSLTRGHVLVRGPVRSGLTAVRATGS